MADTAPRAPSRPVLSRHFIRNSVANAITRSNVNAIPTIVIADSFLPTFRVSASCRSLATRGYLAATAMSSTLRPCTVRILVATTAESKPFRRIAARGEKVFQREGCGGCHTPPLYTNNKLTPAESFAIPKDHLKKYEILATTVGTDSDLTLHAPRLPATRSLRSRGFGTAVCFRMMARASRWRTGLTSAV